MSKVLHVALLAMIISTALRAQGPKDKVPLANGALQGANTALQAGEADKALSLIDSLPPSAQSHNLKCRVWLTLGRTDEAAGECEQAVKLDEQNSNDHMWLGRALGGKAEKASFLSAYGLAKRVRAEFEEAVKLNPHNADALADLGEFYTEAPGAVGGGVDKAQGVAARLDKVDVARAHELRARLAEKAKDYAAAEREYKAAVSTSDRPALQWMTLAGFYGRRENFTEMNAAAQSGTVAVKRDKRSAVAFYNGASVLSKGNRNVALAAKLLEQYLASGAKTEEAPAFEAHTRLARLKAQLGDRAGALAERTAALALAHDYKPAQGLKF